MNGNIIEALADVHRELAAIKKSWLVWMCAIGAVYVVVVAPVTWFLLRIS